MDFDGSLEIDSRLLDEIRTLAALDSIVIDDYISLLLEEEILKEITKSLVSDSSIY